MNGIFLSHSSRDDGAAREMAEWLRGRGLEALFLDFDPACGIPAGRDWEQELYHQMRRCRAVIALCSEDFLASRWCFAEVVMARMLGKGLFPVRIGPCDPPSLLKTRQMVDLTADPEEGHERLWRGLITAGIDPRDVFLWDVRRPPYPGLMAFQEEDAALFFGRDEAIADGLDSLGSLRRYGGRALLLLLGASGCGKSSLALAGLVPRLRRDPEGWLVVDPFRPGSDPFRELAIGLAAAFARQGRRLEAGPLAARLDVPEAGIGGAARELRDMLEELRVLSGHRQATVLLTLDQMEELLGGAEPPDGAVAPPGTRFLALLRAALEPAEGRLVVLATLRSDFLGAFQCHPALQGLRYAQLPVGPMGPEAYGQIIEGPAEVAGLRVEPGLGERMVQDTATEDALPLLAFTLRELWERHGREDGALTLDEYARRLGGLVGSVQRAADGVLAARPLSTGEAAALREAFLAMTRINPEGQYVRRPVHRDQVPPAALPLLERFVEARLLTSGKEGGTFEVAHEALLRSWPLLKGWLDENREFLLWRQRLQAALEEYDRNRLLLRDAQLVEAQRWRTATAAGSPERGLIDASLGARRRQRRRRRLALAGAAAAVAAFTGSLGWQLLETRRAQALQFHAHHRALIASSPLESVIAGLAAMQRFARSPGTRLQLGDSLARAVAANLAIAPPLPAGQGEVTALAALGEWELVSGGSDGSLRIWRDGKPSGAAIATGQGRVTSVVDQGDGTVVTGGGDGTLRRWRDGGPLGRPLPAGQGAVTQLLALGDGELISAGSDGSLRRWRDGRALGGALASGHGEVTALLALGDGSLVSAGRDGTLRRWRDGRPVGEPIATGQGTVYSLVLQPDGVLVSGGGDGTLRRWRDGRPLGDRIDTGQGAVL
ncbi:MAG: TIR domain-containing protein, partial [Synechococcaceae cyanobacterium]|nr:TIR domain-containing protein [Synechococcaceae cyanobacterium]